MKRVAQRKDEVVTQRRSLREAILYEKSIRTKIKSTKSYTLREEYARKDGTTKNKTYEKTSL